MRAGAGEDQARYGAGRIGSVLNEKRREPGEIIYTAGRIVGMGVGGRLTVIELTPP
jgi:hypothetical protein